MKLMYAQGARFFKLFDMLTVYAHERLHVVKDDEFFTGEPPRGLSQDAQRMTARELWQAPGIIDDFVTENPGKLNKRELDIVRSWNDAYPALAFFDRCPDGHVRAFLDDYVVDVCGMGIDFDDMLTELPVMAWIVLLPFEGYIVYDTSIEELPVAMGRQMVEVFSAEMTAALAEGRILRAGYDLSAVVPKLKQRHLDAEMEQFRRSMDLEERAAGPHKGQHRGKLAGIHGEERRRLVDEHMKSDDVYGYDALELIEGQCLPGEPMFGLHELLEADAGVPGNEEFTSRVIESFDGQVAELVEEARLDPNVDADQLEELLRKADEAKQMMGQADPIEMIEERVTRLDLLEDELFACNRRQLEKLRKLAEAGGHMTFPYEEKPSFRNVPAPMCGLCYLFSWDGAIHAVMPREVVPVAQRVDWDGLTELDDAETRFANFIDCALDLRGIAEVDELLEEYRTQWGCDHAPDVLYENLIDGLYAERIGGTVLDTGKTKYLLHFQLASIHHEVLGRNPYDAKWRDTYVIEEPLDDSLRGLLALQRGKDPRPVTEDMMKEGSAFFWKMDQPPSLALMDYLDEHVPDDANEYSFAEKVLEEALEEQQFGPGREGVEEFFAVLERNGLVPDESQVPELLNLWQNLCNGLPIWPNNGWAPNELVGRELGKPMFFNPDGSVMKVGRNDPCPCGSGKKYKNCCGR